MKKVLVTLLALLAAGAAFAQDSQEVRWRRIAGVITALNVDNPVGKISAGTFAWTARGGSARVNLATGAAAFDVDGLVIDGTMFSGTTGPITAVMGTLVCNVGTNNESPHDTSPVPFSATGNADFSGQITGIPSPCANPLFLIRIAAPAGALGRWIATGAERTGGAQY
jgi:hypothetical protein